MLALCLYTCTAIGLYDFIELFIFKLRIIEGKIIGILLLLGEMLHRTFLLIAFVIGVVGRIRILSHDFINPEAACQQHKPLWVDMSVPFVFLFHHYFPPVYL